MTSSTIKFNALVGRLIQKIKVSQAPVPGFIVGLSGTDSIVAFVALYTAMQQAKLQKPRLYGVHYISKAAAPSTTFEREGFPFLRALCPEAVVELAVPAGGNRDPQRWADLHLRSLSHVSYAERSGVDPIVQPREAGENYWIAGTINATEHAMGKHSLLANTVSIQPIRSLWKSEIMALCQEWQVPQAIIDAARIPDCMCGRDELAAENIELIDAILRNDFDPSQHDPILLKKLIDYVRDQKRDGGFRQRVPYLV